ncbi:F-box domain containing protein [Tanacetum coccineum]
MSDHIPFEIQSEIIKRLPVKSVVQFRSVSKLWKSLIDSLKFIKSYHSCKTHLFVKYKIANNLKYLLIADDDTFPDQKSPLTVPQPVCLLDYISTLDSVNGMLCFYGSRQDAMDDHEKIVVLWNPSIGKAVGITTNSLLLPDGLTFIGFGVCPNTSDLKLVKINTIGSSTVNWEVEESNLIISFDLKSDEFGEVCLPDRLVNTSGLALSEVYESLGLFEYYNDGDISFCDAWIMKEGVTKSLTKMLSIKAPDTWARYRLLELRKNGEVIIENIDDTNSSVLEVCEPSSGRTSGVGINGSSGSFRVNSYMETLLLLDESNSIIH